jgi:hypothetical protein
MNALRQTILGIVLGTSVFSGSARAARFVGTEEVVASKIGLPPLNLDLIQPKPEYSPFPTTIELDRAINQLPYPGPGKFIPGMAAAEARRAMEVRFSPLGKRPWPLPSADPFSIKAFHAEFPDWPHLIPQQTLASQKSFIVEKVVWAKIPASMSDYLQLAKSARPEPTSPF